MKGIQTEQYNSNPLIIVIYVDQQSTLILKSPYLHNTYAHESQNKGQQKIQTKCFIPLGVITLCSNLSLPIDVPYILYLASIINAWLCLYIGPCNTKGVR